MTQNELRLQGDDLADKAFIWIKANPEIYEQLLSVDTNEGLEQFKNGHGDFSRLCSQMQLPDDSDHELLQSGTRFFEKHAREILTVLGLYSLPYCYAGANGVRVLAQSKKIKEEPARRLMETAQFVFDACQRNAFQTNGRGILSTLKVRLMHAAARHYTSKVIEDEVPVNQEDMVGTMLAFSLIVIRGMRKMGIDVSQRDAEAYNYLWIRIGALMGIAVEHIPSTIRGASLMEQKIRKKEFARSEEGVLLTRVLTEHYQTQKEALGSVDPTDLMYFFLGEDVSEILGIVPTSILKRELLAVGLRSQHFFKRFHERNFPAMERQFQQSLAQENVATDFRIPN